MVWEGKPYGSGLDFFEGRGEYGCAHLLIISSHWQYMLVALRDMERER